MPYHRRLLVADSKTIYVEMRARVVPGAYKRDNLICTYVNMYSINDEEQVTVRHVECDRIHG